MTTPRPLKIATAQFENRSGDKAYNLATIDRLAARAKQAGADVVAFHECSVSGYTFARHLSRAQMLDLAEIVDSEGPSVRKLTAIARAHDIALLAGFFEKDRDGRLHKAHVCIEPERGLIAKFRKLHPFIHPDLLPGTEYVVFDLFGWKCGILICYDNNVIENVRATALLGAEIIFMPHVTMCTPSTRPGAGFVDPALWTNREADPTSLRLEFDGMKGRGWLMKWLPARAYDNGIYAVFSNAIGMDDDQLKNGCSMIVDPFGDVLAECRTLGDDIAVATCTHDKLEKAGGYRYRNARRPELFGTILGQPHVGRHRVAWMDEPSVDAGLEDESKNGNESKNDRESNR
ncbi:nitrilase family protein [Pendulispora albinea]|uniref:Nitrilase family protein n=1 Tax=Pendulispora albinea TaxID=2741071 RepID=A0ABZ2M1U7_9BACT